MTDKRFKKNEEYDYLFKMVYGFYYFRNDLKNIIFLIQEYGDDNTKKYEKTIQEILEKVDKELRE